MELIHTKMRKSAGLHGGICFIKMVSWDAKFIYNLQNLENEAKNFNCGEESWIKKKFFFQYLDHNRLEKRFVNLPYADQKKIDWTMIKWLAFFCSSVVKNLPAMQETWVHFMSREDPL